MQAFGIRNMSAKSSASRLSCPMNTNLSAADLRRWAMQCGTRANDPMITGDERDRLLKMQESLLYLAENNDWLEGRPTPASVASSRAA
jgi:hypothetical protein